MRIVKFSLRGNNYSLFGLNSTFLNMQKKKQKDCIGMLMGLWEWDINGITWAHKK